MSNAEIFRTYLARFTSGDRESAAELLTEDFLFHGPMLRSEGKEEGDELCSIYDFTIETRPGRRRFRWPSGTRSVTASSRSARLIFDTAAKAALLPSS